MASRASPGKGSTFWIELPFAKQSGPSRTVPAAP
jgi:hypothetical protein